MKEIKKKKQATAPIDGPDGVDRWSSNGYGLMLDGEPVIPVPEKIEDQIDELEETE